MTLLELIERVAARCNQDADNTDTKERLTNHINDSIKEKWEDHDWSFLVREYPLVLTADVESGTVTATNGSRTVTASGTPFVSGTHENAWLRFTGDSSPAWYRVLSVDSTSSITIEPAYQGTTASGKSYELKRTDYLLPSEVEDVLEVVRPWSSPLRPTYLIGNNYEAPAIGRGLPTTAELFDADIVGSTYSTGTISGTTATATVTGSGTSWLANVQPGDKLTVGSYTYTIYKVNSDTSLTLYNYQRATSSTASYSIKKQFGRYLRLTPTANEARVVFVRGLRKYAPLIHDNDVNEMTDRFASAIIESAVWRELGSGPDPREDSNYMKAEAFWDKALAKDRKRTPRLRRGGTWSPRMPSPRRTW